MNKLDNLKNTWKGIRNLTNNSAVSSIHFLPDNNDTTTDPIHKANIISNFSAP